LVMLVRGPRFCPASHLPSTLKNQGADVPRLQCLVFSCLFHLTTSPPSPLTTHPTHYDDRCRRRSTDQGRLVEAWWVERTRGPKPNTIPAVPRDHFSLPNLARPGSLPTGGGAPPQAGVWAVGDHTALFFPEEATAQPGPPPPNPPAPYPHPLFPLISCHATPLPCIPVPEQSQFYLAASRTRRSFSPPPTRPRSPHSNTAPMTTGGEPGPSSPCGGPRASRAVSKQRLGRR